jgi:hypothetical protein
MKICGALALTRSTNGSGERGFGAQFFCAFLRSVVWKGILRNMRDHTKSGHKTREMRVANERLTSETAKNANKSGEPRA